MRENFQFEKKINLTEILLEQASWSKVHYTFDLCKSLGDQCS